MGGVAGASNAKGKDILVRRKTMAILEDLLRIKGVLIAGEFTEDGRLVRYRTAMDMSADTAAITAQFCATVTTIFDTMAAAYKHLTKTNCLPQHGWIFTGGEWTIAVGGKCGVLAETAKIDFNELHNALLNNRAVDALRGSHYYVADKAAKTCAPN